MMSRRLGVCLLVLILAIVAAVTITLASTAISRSDDTIARIDRKIEMYERGR